MTQRQAGGQGAGVQDDVRAPRRSRQRGVKSRGPRKIELPDALPVNRLAELIGISPIEVIKQLMRNGVMANINQVVDYDIAAAVVADFGMQPVRHMETQSGGRVQAGLEQEDPSKLMPRPAVVTMLGHVDHGKTTLLDAIRESNVTAREVGGITQHIGAYQVDHQGNRITFVDTPGHEAFTAMRARGAQVTDIAVLVVAADDGIMPQTVEAINHAKAADVPIMVAINKIDSPGAEPDRVKRQLTEHGLVVEEWGGETIAVEVSARERLGIEDLLENITVLAEILELKANPDRPAKGVVIEARVDKNRGPLATVLVQNGTLKTGDTVTVGQSWGRVRAMFNEAGRRVRQADPSTPVEVLGLNEQPETGDILEAVIDERTAKEVTADRRQSALREQAQAPTLEEVYSRIRTGEIKDLNLVVKTDVQGTVGAVRDALERLSSQNARVHLIHTGSGSITESDVMLASASEAVIIGFSTRPEPGARRLAETMGVEIRYYDIIYRLVEDIQKALKGLLEPEQKEIFEGRAEVRAVFSVGRRSKAAGIFVQDGRVTRNSRIRVMRGGETIHDGRVSSLKHFKDDVREVANGREGGLTLEDFTDFQEGDILQAYRWERSS